MSYSFTVRTETKAAAKELAATKFEQVVGSQPIHDRDRAAVLALIETFVDLLVEDETKYINVDVNGTLTWQGTLEPGGEATIPLSAVGVSVSAYHEPREA